jgi:hypothetical protein
MMLETCRGTEFYVIYKIVYQVGINKIIFFDINFLLMHSVFYHPGISNLLGPSYPVTKNIFNSLS